MELRQLRYFVIVAEELDFTRPAERLQMAQPPLSQQMHHLEQDPGADLFHQVKRRIELTRAGQVFLGEPRLPGACLACARGLNAPSAARLDGS